MNIRLYYQWTMAALLLTAAGCSNDDIQTANITNTDKETTEIAQTSFVTGEESLIIIQEISTGRQVTKSL